MIYPFALRGLEGKFNSFLKSTTVLGKHRCIGYQIHLAGLKSRARVGEGAIKGCGEIGKEEGAEVSGVFGANHKERLLTDEFFRNVRRDVVKSIIREVR